MIRALSRTVFSALLAGAFSPPALAGPITVQTALGVDWALADAGSLDAALGFATRRTASGAARLMWEQSAGRLRFEAHLLIGAARGDEIAYRAALAPFLPPAPPASLFDPSLETGAGDLAMAAGIDRLSVAWSSENLVLKLGRQALTWGEGLVFHPGDIVAPFAPDATDTGYKPGVEMLYGQYLFASGADLQAIWVPRPAVAGGAVAPDASTLALRASFRAGAVDVSLMGARDRGDAVVGLGLAGPLGQGSWKAEYVGWKLTDSGLYRPSWLLSYANFVTLGDVGVSWFGEYFRNGFAAAPGTALDSLPGDLLKRLGTGQVFLTGQDYLALGASLQLAPELSLSPLGLVSLDDGSALLSLGVDWALGDNTNLTASWSQPLGGPGTSFGGLETSSGSGIYATPPRRAGLKLVHYF